MIQITNVHTCNWEAAMRGMRNPKDSWHLGDTTCVSNPYQRVCDVFIGPNDHALAMKLAKAGTEHAKYRRMIIVSFDVKAPLWWWKQFDAYKVGTVTNSCSTMHKIHEYEFYEEDFSFDYLEAGTELYKGDDAIHCAYRCTQQTIDKLNRLRAMYLETVEKLKDESISDAMREHLELVKKYYWRALVELLPSSYMQLRTITTNYETLAAIYRQRKNHKLDEWRDFCDFITMFLPYSEFITLKEG